MERLPGRSDGTCPVGTCGRSAYAWTTDGLEGHVDACEVHAAWALAEALAPARAFRRRFPDAYAFRTPIGWAINVHDDEPSICQGATELEAWEQACEAMEIMVDHSGAFTRADLEKAVALVTAEPMKTTTLDKADIIVHLTDGEGE